MKLLIIMDLERVTWPNLGKRASNYKCDSFDQPKDEIPSGDQRESKTKKLSKCAELLVFF